MRRWLLISAVFLASLPQAMTAQAKPTAVFAGTVVDSLQRAIPNAEVALPDLSIKGLTAANGTFRFEGIPAGSQRVTVRRIGFGQLDTSLVFTDDQMLERLVQLGRVTTLDEIRIDVKRDPQMVEFDDNRARGVGRFLTRADLAKMDGRTLGNAMEQLQGLDIVRGKAGQGWVTGKRAPMSRCRPTQVAMSAAVAAAEQDKTDTCLRSEGMYYVPDPGEQRDGVKRQCYAQVYQDRSLMNSGRPTPPFDLNTLIAGQIEAIEWYESASQLPLKYRTREAVCGVVIIHSRR